MARKKVLQDSVAQAEPVLLDRDGVIRYVRLPNIELGEPASELGGATTFARIQTHAWFSFLRAMAAASKPVSDGPAHLSRPETIKWLNDQLSRVHLDGYSVDRIAVNDFVRDDTLQRIEAAVPGSAGVYFWGPDLSVLWSALSGKDDGQAEERFQSLSGVSLNRVRRGGIDLLDGLLDAAPIIALHAAAALVAKFAASCRSSLGTDFAFLPYLHASSYLEAQRAVRRHDDAVAGEILDNPWYERALACLRHDSAIRRLALHGLCLDDIFLATGDPTLMPRVDAGGFKFSMTSREIQLLRLYRARTPSDLAAGGGVAETTLAELARTIFGVV
jgi:hypothetical protein